VTQLPDLLTDLARRRRGVSYEAARSLLGLEDASMRHALHRARQRHQLLPPGAVVLRHYQACWSPLAMRIVRRLHSVGWHTVEELASDLREPLDQVENSVRWLRATGVVHPARMVWARPRASRRVVGAVEVSLELREAS
jgi:hypothetical protein